MSRDSYFKISLWLKGILCSLVICAWVPSPGTALEGFREKAVLVGTQTSNDLFFPASVTTNPSDSTHFAYLIKRDDHFFAVIDGRESMPHEAVSKGTPFFNHDGSRYVYIAHKGEKAFVMSDGVAQPEFDGVDRPVFSPDGTRLAYRARKGDQQMVVEDGNIVKAFEGIKGYPVFSPDSTHLIFTGVNGKKVSIVLDGKIIVKDCENVKELTFSPDSTHLAFAVKKKGLWYLAKDKKIAAKGYHNIQNLVFSEDSSQFAFAAQQGKDLFIVMQNSETGEFVESNPYTTVGALLFSPDGKHAAFAVLKGEKWRIVLDQAEGPEFKKLASLKFSPDSRWFAYSGVTEKDRGAVVVIDLKAEAKAGQTIHTYDSAGQVVFSPDASRMAWRARKGRHWHMVCDGKESEPYDMVRRPFFSPDSQKTAYTAVKGDNMCVVVNGEKEKSYKAVGLPWFSSDSAHLAYKALDRKKWRINLDGVEGETHFDAFLKGEPIVFEENHCHILAFNQKEFEFLRYEIYFEK